MFCTRVALNRELYRGPYHYCKNRRSHSSCLAVLSITYLIYFSTNTRKVKLIEFNCNSKFDFDSGCFFTNSLPQGFRKTTPVSILRRWTAPHDGWNEQTGNPAVGGQVGRLVVVSCGDCDHDHRVGVRGMSCGIC